MGYKFANFINATLQQAIEASTLTIYIEPEMEALLPALVGGNVIRAVLFDQTLDPEIIDVTAHSGGALTIVRSKESTTAQAWPTGTRFTLDVTAALLDALINTTTQSSFTGTASGTNAITVTMGAGATIPVPADGDEVYFTVVNTTTGAVTLTVTNGTTSIGPTAVVDPFGGALEDGDILTGLQARVRYQSSMAKWILVSLSSRNVQVKSVNDGPVLPSDRNTNGRFDYWNAGTSFASPVSGTVTADGYYVEFDGTIGTFTPSRQTFTLGQTTVPGNPVYFYRWDQGTAGSGSTFRRIRTKCGRVAISQGKKRVRSIWAKADAARTVTGKLIQNFGTGGGPSADVIVATLAMNLTTSWQEFDLAATMPSIAGKTLGSNLDDAVILELSLPVNTTMTIDFAMDQYEPGDTPSLADSPYPWDTRFGGTGASYATQALLISAFIAAYGSDLPALEALATTGLAVRTGAGTWATRSLTAPAAGIGISNGDGVAGNPTFSLANDLASLEAFAGTGATGLAYRSGADTWAGVTIAAGLGFAAGTLGSALGTAATQNTGTSGATLPFLNGNNTYSGTADFTSTLTMANNIAVQGKESGGTARQLILIDGSNIVQVGNATNNTNIRGAAISLAVRPTFNGNTALDTVNGAALAGAVFTGAIQVTTIEVGAATDTTFARSGAGKVSVEAVVLADLGSATQTFTGDLVGANVAVSNNLSLGYRRLAPASITTGTIANTDVGKCVYATGAVTAPNAVFAQGDGIGVQAGASSRTITQGASVTMTNGNTGVTGSCTLAANGYCLILYTSSSACTVYGNV